jgi:hypothetical protein
MSERLAHRRSHLSSQPQLRAIKFGEEGHFWARLMRTVSEMVLSIAWAMTGVPAAHSQRLPRRFPG